MSDQPAASLPADPCVRAAADYRAGFDWNCGAQDTEVWLCLPYGTGAVDVDQPLASRLRDALREQGVRGPIIGCPGSPAYWVFFVRGARVLDPETRAALTQHGATYRGARRLVDLPPTHCPTGPLTWIDPPCEPATFPELATLLVALRAARTLR